MISFEIGRYSSRENLKKPKLSQRTQIILSQENFTSFLHLTSALHQTMTASVAMSNYFHALRQREDFGTFEIVMDNPRTFSIAPEVQQEEDSKVSKAEKRWSQSLDLSAAATFVSISKMDAPFLPKRRLSMDVLADEQSKQDLPPSPIIRSRRGTPRTCQRKKNKIPE